MLCKAKYRDTMVRGTSNEIILSNSKRLFADGAACGRGDLRDHRGADRSTRHNRY